MVFSGSEDMNGFYSNFIPPVFVYNNFDLKYIESYIKRQKKAIKKVDNPWSLLLLDDRTDDVKIFTDPLMIGVYKRGRHWKMLHLLSLQYSLDLKPNIRTNIDGVFILREQGKKQRKQLWENYDQLFLILLIFVKLWIN